MAVAVPKRGSTAQGAPAPSRTAPPEPKKRPRDRPRPGGKARSATAAPAAPPKRKPASPIRKTGPGRKKATSARASTAAPARKAPARRKVAPKRRPAGVIPIAAGHAGRAAVAVTQLPESGLIHRLTRGRAWIGVLGVLLVGIVALNVVTLSFAATSGKVDAKNTELSKENTMLQGLVSKETGQAKLRHEAGKLGLAMSTDAVPQLINAHGGDVAKAAARLAAAAPATGAEGEASGEEAASGEEGASGEESATGEEAASGEETAAGTTGESEFTAEEEAIYNREYEELLAAEGAESGVVEEVVTE
jgi:hypothetical protein